MEESPESHTGLVSRAWHSVVDPIFHLNDKETAEEPAKKEAITETLSRLSKTAEPPIPVIPETETHPGLASRI
jgi:hypothetical protein